MFVRRLLRADLLESDNSLSRNDNQLGRQPKSQSSRRQEFQDCIAGGRDATFRRSAGARAPWPTASVVRRECAEVLLAPQDPGCRRSRAFRRDTSLMNSTSTGAQFAFFRIEYHRRSSVTVCKSEPRSTFPGAWRAGRIAREAGVISCGRGVGRRTCPSGRAPDRRDRTRDRRRRWFPAGAPRSPASG